MWKKTHQTEKNAMSLNCGIKIPDNNTINQQKAPNETKLLIMKCSPVWKTYPWQVEVLSCKLSYLVSKMVTSVNPHFFLTVLLPNIFADILYQRCFSFLSSLACACFLNYWRGQKQYPRLREIFWKMFLLK